MMEGPDQSNSKEAIM